MMQSLFKQAHQEVIDLHIQIENLFHNKAIENKRQPFLSYFHPAFTMIPPDGLLRDLTWLTNWYQTAAGTRPEVKISVENFKQTFVCAECVIVTFEEYQQVTATESLHRLSTAVFVPTKNPTQPVLWRHLHETWVKK